MVVSEPTVGDQIIQVLDALCEKFGLVIDWTSENVAPYLTTLASRLIAYEIWTSVAWMAIAIVVGIAVIAISTRPNTKRLFTDVDPLCVPVTILLVILGIFSISGIISQTMDIIKCVTFPEMYIFEYIQTIINSGS